MDENWKMFLGVLLVVVLIFLIIKVDTTNEKLNEELLKSEKLVEVYDLEMKTMQDTIITLENQNRKLKEDNKELEELKKKRESPKTSRGLDNDEMKYLGVFESTSYDLSVQSCGKKPDHSQYGLTASGVFVSGMTRSEAMSIAVDPKVIPLGSKVYIEFPSPYEGFSGVYTARDTGSAIKGNIIDLFMGDFGKIESDQSVWDFGRRKVKIWLVK